MVTALFFADDMLNVCCVRRGAACRDCGRGCRCSPCPCCRPAVLAVTVSLAASVEASWAVRAAAERSSPRSPGSGLRVPEQGAEETPAGAEGGEGGGAADMMRVGVKDKVESRTKTRAGSREGTRETTTRTQPTGASDWRPCRDAGTKGSNRCSQDQVNHGNCGADQRR